MEDSPSEGTSESPAGCVVVPLPSSVRLPKLASAEKPCWRSQLFEPILRMSSQEERWFTPLGGPPRQLREAGKIAIAKPAAPKIEEEAATTPLPKPPQMGQDTRRRPLQPRLAIRRMRLARQKTTSTSSSRRATSPLTLQESRYVREVVGTGTLFRGSLDMEEEQHNADNKEFATYRMSCRREAEKMARAQAARWREVSNRQEGLYELRWKLLHCANLVVSPVAPQEIPAEGSDHGDACHSRAPTPAESMGHSGQRPAGGLKLRRRPKELLDTDGDSLGSSDDESEHETSIQRPSARNMTVATLPRPKQPLKVRMQRLKKAAKEWRRCYKEDYIPGYGFGDGPRESVAGVGIGTPSGDKQRGSLIFGRPRRELLDRRTIMMDVLDVPVLPDAQERIKTSLEKERAAFQRVISLYDRGGIGSIDQAELRNCLKELGLRGRTDAERNEIRAILFRLEQLEVSMEEFTTLIVPQVRKALLDLRREELQSDFKKLCKDESQCLSLNEVDHYLRCNGIHFSEEVLLEIVADSDAKTYEKIRALSGTWLKNRSVLPLEHFCTLVAMAEERTERERQQLFRQLSSDLRLEESEQEAWQPILVQLYKAVNGPDHLSMDVQQAVALLRKLSLVPKTKGISGTLSLTVRSEGGKEGIDFAGLVKILTKLWELERPFVLEVFERYDGGRGTLTFADLPSALEEYGVKPRDRDEVDFMMKCMEECDEEGAKEVDIDEFMSLCHIVTLRLNWKRCEKERRLAMEFGWDEVQFEDVRAAFLAIDEDMSDYLDRDEIVKALAMINPNVRMDTFSAFPAIGLNPAAEDLKIHFGEFLKLMMHLDLKEASKGAKQPECST